MRVETKGLFGIRWALSSNLSSHEEKEPPKESGYFNPPLALCKGLNPNLGSSQRSAATGAPLLGPQTQGCTKSCAKDSA